MPIARLEEHELKCWPEYFSAHLTGRKNFEIRGTSDRKFRVGDILVLREFEPCRICGGSGNVGNEGGRARCECLSGAQPKGTYTCRSIRRLILYITDFGQPEGQVVMGLAEWHGAEESGRRCPNAGRVHEIADQLRLEGAYTQAQEVEALSSELQKERAAREQLLQEIRALRPAVPIGAQGMVPKPRIAEDVEVLVV